MVEFKRGRYYTHRSFKDVFVRLVDVKQLGLKFYVTFEYYNRGQGGGSYAIRTSRHSILTDRHIITYNQLHNWLEYDPSVLETPCE